MLGKIIYKPIIDNKDYADTAIWCNSNNCYIADKGDYYEVVANAEPDIATLKYMKYLELKSIADKIINDAVKSDYAQGEIDTFQQQYEGAIDILNNIFDTKSAIFVTDLANNRSKISGITITPYDLSCRIVNNYERARELTLNVLAKRQGLSDYLYSNEVTTKEQIDNIKW